MFNHLIFMLAARRNDNDSGKWIGGLIFLLIWAITAIASLMKKRQDEQRKRDQSGQQSMPFPPLPERREPPAPAPARRTPAPPRINRPTPSQQPRRFPKLPEKRVQRQQSPRPVHVPRVPVVVTEEIEEEVRPLAVLQQTKTSPRLQNQSQPAAQKRSLPHADANSLRNWLKPETLRAQFILTELFQPPLALREERKS